MLPKVICCLPLRNGTSFSEQTWGMIEIAKRLTGSQSQLIGIVVHAGLEPAEITSLPADEVYHVKLDQARWKVADYHVQALQCIFRIINATEAIYLFSANPLYQEAAVRLAVRNNAGIITNAMDLIRDDHSTSLTVKREIYREKAHEFVACNDVRQQYITLDTTILCGERQQGKPGKVQEIQINQYVPGKVWFVGESIINWKDLALTEARCVIGIGRGVNGATATSMENILQLAELLNAPIGGSKVADELGLIPREKRIGSSGCSIDADIYVAIGISGSSQHLEGIKGVKHVIAINNDPSAPIFQRCDIGIVGDYEVVVPKIVESLQRERQDEANLEHLRIG